MKRSAQMRILDHYSDIVSMVELECLNVLLNNAGVTDGDIIDGWMSSVQIYNSLDPNGSARWLKVIADGYRLNNSRLGGCATPYGYVGAILADLHNRGIIDRLEHDINHFPNAGTESRNAFRIRV